MSILPELDCVYMYAFFTCFCIQNAEELQTMTVFFIEIWELCIGVHIIFLFYVQIIRT